MSYEEAASFTIQPLQQFHERSLFASGNESLDRYLKQQATQDLRRYAAATFVLTQKRSTAVIGYSTLAMTGVVLTSFSPEVQKRLPRYPVVPAVLLGRLARDQRCSAMGLGKLLLLDALSRSFRSEIPAAAVVIDAFDEQATGFYCNSRGDRQGYVTLSINLAARNPRR
ncbi:GNAT family N-acetyltransferase [Gloeobacter morelensis]|uniref:GNAT family N-acetyltransferase n=1 Tax=Gloeobacter morelensis MG652769 TaxID=2781736 RepID=A0ABY3PTC1_9CYAN|nr:GNAT family N-acetyltransferase [Gloeobacter morelensis]UFP96764.1 GNAT family N-acetyltransferase [Gloeobacter morelensis MG652769]